MNQDRRALFAASALVPLAIVGCAADGKTSASVEQFIASVQAWMPFVSAGVLGVSAFIPNAAPFLPLIQSGLSAVSGILATMSTTMTAAEAQTPAQKIVAAMQATMSSVHQLVGVIPAANQPKVQAIVSAADGITAQLAILVANMASLVPAPQLAAAARADTKLLYIRAVRR